MKRNISRMDEVDFDHMTYAVERCHKPGDTIKMEYDYFMEMMDSIIEDLNTIMPAKYQKGLIFKITTQLGAMKPRERLRATWITVERGSKDWFITDIEVKRPSTGDIHPVNMAVGEDNHDRLWSIIEHVTSPGWFNRKNS